MFTRDTDFNEMTSSEEQKSGVIFFSRPNGIAPPQEAQCFSRSTSAPRVQQPPPPPIHKVPGTLLSSHPHE